MIERRRCQVFNTKPSRTQQEFREECNINKILEKAKKHGLPAPTEKGFFGDFCGMDFRDMQNVLVIAQEAFMALDPKVRRRFNNDAAQLIEFIEDESNKDEAIKLGLVPAPEVKPEVTPVPTT